MHMLRFDGQVALVTGAAGGLGEAWVKLLQSRGAKLMLVDIDPRVEDIAKGLHCQAQIANCADDGRRIVENTLKIYGRIDILIHAATCIRDSAFRKMTREQWNEVIDNDLTSAFNMTRAVWPTMRQQSYGRIILCTSASGLYGNFGQVNYAASKMALWG